MVETGENLDDVQDNAYPPKGENEALNADSITIFLSLIPKKVSDAFLVCAVPHTFDQDMFAWLCGDGEEADRLWREILSFPNILHQAKDMDRYRFHPSDREQLLESFRGKDPDHLRDCHTRAASYCQQRLAELKGADPTIAHQEARSLDREPTSDMWQREYMYHLLAADQKAGWELFQVLFRSAKQDYQIALCHRLVDLAKEQSYWLDQTKTHLLTVYESSLVFVGRQEEQEALVRALESRERRLRVIYVVGQGGIGKTRLMEEFWSTFSQRYYPDDPDVAIPLVDLYGMDQRRVTGVEYEIAQVLGSEKFTFYFQAFARYRDVRQEMTDVTSPLQSERLNTLRSQVHATFLSNLADLSNDIPVLLMFDSFETAKDSDVADWMFRALLTTLRDKNFIVILASRPNGMDFGELQTQVTTLQLERFNKSEIIRYFRERDLPNVGNLAHRILRCTDGHPILVALLADLVEKESISLPTLLEGDAQDFAKALIGAFLRSRPQEAAVLSAMALARYRFGEDLLAELLNIDQSEARAALGNISDYTSFTKFRPETSTYVLHDKIREAVIDLEWQTVEKRRSWNKQIIDYYDRQIQRLQKASDQVADEIVGQASRIQLLEAERLFYLLDFDFESGLKAFNDKFDQAIRLYNLGAAELLVRTVLEYRAAFGIEDWPDKVDLKRAELDFRQGHFERADTRAQEILARPALDRDVEALAWLMRARVARHIGNLLDAESFCRRALWHTEVDPDLRDVTTWALDIMGYTRRVRGEWKKAVDYYLKNLELRGREREGNERWIANTQNNLAYVYLLLGKPRKALHLVNKALDTRERLVQQARGNRVELGLSYNTRGMIYRRLGETAKANKDFERAQHLFEDVHNQRGLGLVYINYGLRERHRLDPGALEEAARYFNKSVEIFQDLNDQEDLAEALNELGMTYLDQGNWERAEQAFLQALDLAERTHNEFRMADILTNMVQLYHFKRDPAMLDACARRFEKADGFSYHYSSAQLFVVLTRANIAQGHLVRALWYALRAVRRMLAYGGLNINVWASWVRDWIRWRRRIRRLRST